MYISYIFIYLLIDWLVDGLICVDMNAELKHARMTGNGRMVDGGREKEKYHMRSEEGRTSLRRNERLKGKKFAAIGRIDAGHVLEETRLRDVTLARQGRKRRMLGEFAAFLAAR